MLEQGAAQVGNTGRGTNGYELITEITAEPVGSRPAETPYP